MSTGENLLRMLDQVAKEPGYDELHEENITRMVISCLIHSSGFLHTGVAMGKRLDIEQYGAVRETITRLQHVLDNQ